MSKELSWEDVCRSLRQMKGTAIEFQLSEFVRMVDPIGWPVSFWLISSTMKVYVRKSWRLAPLGKITNELHPHLDIASIEVKPRLQNQGHFTRLLDHAEKINPWFGVFIENVLTERLGDFLLHRGYLMLSNPKQSRNPSYVKVTQRQ